MSVSIKCEDKTCTRCENGKCTVIPNMYVTDVKTHNGVPVYIWAVPAVLLLLFVVGVIFVYRTRIKGFWKNGFKRLKGFKRLG